MLHKKGSKIPPRHQVDAWGPGTDYKLPEEVIAKYSRKTNKPKRKLIVISFSISSAIGDRSPEKQVRSASSSSSSSSTIATQASFFQTTSSVQTSTPQSSSTTASDAASILVRLALR